MWPESCVSTRFGPISGPRVPFANNSMAFSTESMGVDMSWVTMLTRSLCRSWRRLFWEISLRTATVLASDRFPLRRREMAAWTGMVRPQAWLERLSSKWEALQSPSARRFRRLLGPIRFPRGFPRETYDGLLGLSYQSDAAFITHGDVTIGIDGEDAVETLLNSLSRCSSGSVEST